LKLVTKVKAQYYRKEKYRTEQSRTEQQKLLTIIKII